MILTAEPKRYQLVPFTLEGSYNETMRLEKVRLQIGSIQTDWLPIMEFVNLFGCGSESRIHLGESEVDVLNSYSQLFQWQYPEIVWSRIGYRIVRSKDQYTIQTLSSSLDDPHSVWIESLRSPHYSKGYSGIWQPHRSTVQCICWDLEPCSEVVQGLVNGQKLIWHTQIGGRFFKVSFSSRNHLTISEGSAETDEWDILLANEATLDLTYQLGIQLLLECLRGSFEYKILEVPESLEVPEE